MCKVRGPQRLGNDREMGAKHTHIDNIKHHPNSHQLTRATLSMTSNACNFHAEC